MMNHNSSEAPLSPAPGPVGKFDIQLNEASFPVIRDCLREYPDICRLAAKSRAADTYLVNHPDAVKRVLIDNHKNYIKGVGFERVKLLLGNGIIVSDGEFWKQQRRMVQPAFHRDMLQGLTGMIQKVSQSLLRDWEQAADARQTVNVSEVMSTFGLEVVLRALFSDDLDRIIEENGGNPFAIFTDNTSRDMNLAVKFRALTKLMLAVVARRREQASGEANATGEPDMLDAMLAARDLQGRPMGDKALIDELMTLIVAGHETSAVTLTWMWHLLGEYPGVEERLHREVDAASYEISPAFTDLSQLGYARQVMSETLRVYPPVWLFSRRALQDDVLGNYRIPAQSDLFISPYFLHRREDQWPDPERFDPDRFTDEAVNRRHRAAYIPFSAGPRKCIGDMLSMVEMQIHFGTIARKLRLRPVPGQSIELEPAINLRCKTSIIMMPEYR
jgi:cytochrome P450